MSKVRGVLSVLQVIVWIAVILLSDGTALQACETGPDETAFAWRLADDADLHSSGMMMVGYRDESLMRTTHVTFHRVLRVLPGMQPDLPEEERGHYTVLFTDGTLGPLTYVIYREALFYGTDLDTVGLPRRVWFDSEEDGVNGNERFVFNGSDSLLR